MIIKLSNAINQLAQRLAAISDTPRLDSELLAAEILQRSRSWLFAHGQESLTPAQYEQLQTLGSRRANGEPIAYILGYKEFWGLKLTVTPEVLVPRPETEHLVEWILEKFPENNLLRIADLGTGSGAIALALAKERDAWQIDATDQSESALTIAKQNAAGHQVTNVHFYLGSWYQALAKKQYQVIVSNPPYVAEHDPHLQQLTHEPYNALVSGTDGLNAIREIIAQAPLHLVQSGYIVLEHGYDQALAVANLLQQSGFTDIESHYDLPGQARFTTASTRTPD